MARCVNTFAIAMCPHNMDKTNIYFIFKLLDPRQLNIIITNANNIQRSINKNTKDNVRICHVKRIRNGKVGN